ncbi:hypothetical protein AB0M02_44270 [Actinoplanes sp. NPDC051861]|uniref:hypothetical protein n=1 Tax=Actinoplanes sp. NPDC051861 TaxID=3155170 RepID=UPI0034385335
MKQLTWPAVGLIAVLAGTAIALATLAHWDAGAILGVLGILGGIGGGAAVAGGVAGKVEEVHAETAAQTSQLAVIERQTNGLSTAEREDIARRAAAAAIAAYRAQDGR